MKKQVKFLAHAAETCMYLLPSCHSTFCVQVQQCRSDVLRQPQRRPRVHEQATTPHQQPLVQCVTQRALQPKRTATNDVNNLPA
jgi:hypothetical protein